MSRKHTLGAIVGLVILAAIAVSLSTVGGCRSGPDPQEFRAGMSKSEIVESFGEPADRQIMAGHYLGSGDNDALDLLLSAQSLDPSDKEVADRLKLLADMFEGMGSALMARENYADAAIYYQAALRAVPGKRLRISTVRQRLYRGRCANNGYLPATLDLFRERRPAIEQLVNEQAELFKGAKKSMLDFIDDFYDTIDSPRRLKSSLVARCL